MSTILNRESILADKRKTVEVECPELGGSIILKELSIGQLQKIDNNVINQLAEMIVDETGQRLFKEANDIAALSEMLSASVTTRLIQAAARLNGIAQAAVDEAVKNLLASPNANSASA